MNYVVLLILIFMTLPAIASDQDRYLKPNKVIYEDPQEEDVLMINSSIGYTTVLEFAQKPSMVTTGDSSLLQIEVPKNSKNVLLKALREVGETNLFVFTGDRRFNYKVIVGDKQRVDYVIDVKEALKKQSKGRKKVPVNQLIKMAQNYNVLKELKQINPRIFNQKDIYKDYVTPKLNLKMIEVFSNKAPHYLVVHASINNMQFIPIKLNEKNTNVYVNGEKFKPMFVMFDSTTLEARQETQAWLVLENTYISLDNQFTLGVGVYDKEYIF